MDEHPKGRWKSAAALAAATWTTYNFINARMRASDTARVQAVSKRQGNIILIDTQAYQRVRTRVGRNNVDRYEEQENAKLFIPIPFARIILHCAKSGYPKHNSVGVLECWSDVRKLNTPAVHYSISFVSICEHDSIPLNINRVQFDHARQRQRRE